MACEAVLCSIMLLLFFKEVIGVMNDACTVDCFMIDCKLGSIDGSSHDSSEDSPGNEWFGGL